MEERQITVDGRTYHMQPPFMVLATQNPVEQEGTYRLPEAQLDRFLFKIVVPYPSETEELEILTQFHNLGTSDPMRAIEPVLKGDAIVQVRKVVKEVVIEERLLSFIAKLVHQTRNHKSIYLGASPRASLAIMNASKAMAAMNGRDFVTPDDILEVVPPVLRHRIILSPDKEMEGVSEDSVVRQIIQSLDIPR
jgi:MoxR-like ATPase